MYISRPYRCAAFSLVFVCSACFCSARASPQSTPIKTAGDSYEVCANVAVPPTYALIGINGGAGCPNLLSYVVAPAHSGLNICNLDETIGGAPIKMPFPQGYYVQSISTVEPSRSPCNSATALYMIQPVSEGAAACSGSYIPDGWSFTSSIPGNGACGTTIRNELHQSVDGLRICQGSPYPGAFVIGQVDAVAACGVQESYVIHPVTDGIKGCGNSHVPAGYVITNADRSGRCGSYQTLTMRTAYDGVQACPFSPVPARYVIAATVASNACQDWNTAYQLRYIP